MTVLQKRFVLFFGDGATAIIGRVWVNHAYIPCAKITFSTFCVAKQRFSVTMAVFVSCIRAW
jgi:hypothetical protein